MQWFQELIDYYNHVTTVNPLMAAAAIPVIAGLMFYLRALPTQLANGLLRATTITLNLNNAGWDGNIDAYNTFDKWFMQSGYSRYSRNFFMFRSYSTNLSDDDSDRAKSYRVGVGSGLHIFFYRGRLFWFSKGNLESSGSERQKEQITIRTFGWSGKVFENLVSLFNEKENLGNKVRVHAFKPTDKAWVETGTLAFRDINTFCMNREQKQHILRKISTFIDGQDWYRQKGLTYKTSFLFYGPPGTGKTSLARLLASHFCRDIYVIDLSVMSNASLVDAISKVKPGSILLMEDIDQAGNVVKKRKGDGNEGLSELMSDLGGLTMSGMLNAFDGVVSIDNLIVLYTTNHPEDLDPAIRRKSRIDNEYLIDNLTSVEIKDYLRQVYDLTEPELQRIIRGVECTEWVLPGCEVENIFKEYPDDPEAFVVEITKRSMQVTATHHV